MAAKMKPTKNETIYSLKIKGSPCNYNEAVAFDITDGNLGIDQFKTGHVIERILLSPKQVKELIAFVTENI